MAEGITFSPGNILVPKSESIEQFTTSNPYFAKITSQLELPYINDILSGQWENNGPPTHLEWLVTGFSDKYRQQWGVPECIREVIQNSLDVTDMQNATLKPVVAVDVDTKTIVIKDFGLGWPFDDFQRIGQPSVGGKGGNYRYREPNDPKFLQAGPRSPRGAHGEGGRMALVVLANLGVYVEVRSAKMWALPFFAKMNTLKEPSTSRQLAFVYQRQPAIDQGTEVIMRFADAYQFNSAMQFLNTRVVSGYAPISKTWNGMMYATGKSFYSRDLYVQRVRDGLGYGYNIFSVPLNTDRTGFMDGSSAKGLVENYADLEGYYYGEEYVSKVVAGLILVAPDVIAKDVLNEIRENNHSYEGSCSIQQIKKNTRQYERWKQLFTDVYGKDAVLVTRKGVTEDALNYRGYTPIVLSDSWVQFFTEAGVVRDTQILQEQKTEVFDVSSFFPRARPQKTSPLAVALESWAASGQERIGVDWQIEWASNAIAQYIGKTISRGELTTVFNNLHGSIDNFVTNTDAFVFDDILMLYTDAAGNEISVWNLEDYNDMLKSKPSSVTIFTWPMLTPDSGPLPADFEAKRLENPSLNTAYVKIKKAGFDIAFGVPPGVGFTAAVAGVVVKTEPIPQWDEIYIQQLADRLDSVKPYVPVKTPTKSPVNATTLAMLFDAANVYHQVNGFDWTRGWQLGVFDMEYDSRGAPRPNIRGFAKKQMLAFKRAALLEGYASILELVFHEFTHAATSLGDTDGAFGVALGNIWATFLERYLQGDIHSRFLPKPFSKEAKRFIKEVTTLSALASVSKIEE